MCCSDAVAPGQRSHVVRYFELVSWNCIFNPLISTKLALYSTLHEKVVEHKVVLGEQRSMLKNMRDKLVSDSGTVLGGSVGSTRWITSRILLFSHFALAACCNTIVLNALCFSLALLSCGRPYRFHDCFMLSDGLTDLTLRYFCAIEISALYIRLYVSLICVL